MDTFWLWLLVLIMFVILIVRDFGFESITKWELFKLLFLIILAIFGGIV